MSPGAPQDPFAGVATPVAQVPKDAFAGVATPADQGVQAYTPSHAGQQVYSPTVIRKDGAFWLDASKGLKGQPGWYTWYGGGYDPSSPDPLVARASDSPNPDGTPANSISGDKVLTRLLHGPKDTALGIAQLTQKIQEPLAKAMGMDPQQVTSFPRINQAIQNEQQQYSNARGGHTGFDPIAAVGDATMMAVPVAGEEEAGAGFLNSTLRGGAVGGLFGAAQPVTGTDDYWKAKAQQAATGALAGGAVTGVAKGLSKLNEKGADLIAGTKLGNMLGIPTQLNPEYAGAPELADAMAAKGIRTSVGDVTGDPVIRAREDALARQNPAMMQWRLGQNREAATYADNVVSDLRSQVQQAGWNNLQDLQAAAAQTGKRSKVAQTLLTAINNSGDDWKDVVQQGGNLRLFVNKLKADGLFDNVEAIAKPLGDVPLNTTTQTLNSSIEGLASNTAADPGGLRFLQRINQGIQLAKLDPGATGAQDLSFSGLRAMRSSVNSRISDIVSGKVLASSEELPYLQRLSDSVEKDLGDFAKTQGGSLQKSYSQARDYYQDNVAPYKDAAFGRALASEDPHKAGLLFQGKNTSQQQRFFDLLDPKGQAAVRFGLVDDALDAGEKTDTGTPQGIRFSPAQAALKLEQLQRNGTMGVAFPGGEDSWSAQGLAKVLRTVDRASSVGFIPPTGVTAQSIGAKVEGNQTVLGSAAQGVDWLRKDALVSLFTDPKGRALLQRASGLPLGSQALEKLVQQDIPARVAAIQAAQPSQQGAQ